MAALFLSVTCASLQAQQTSRTLFRAGHVLDLKTGVEPADETIIVQGGIIVDMKPLTAIQTGTINAADLMGWTHKVGTLEAGKRADVIAISGDPLQDVKLLQSVKFVMKAGVVYKSPARAPEGAA